jgi:hypothetical protein
MNLLKIIVVILSLLIIIFSLKNINNKNKEKFENSIQDSSQTAENQINSINSSAGEQALQNLTSTTESTNYLNIINDILSNKLDVTDKKIQDKLTNFTTPVINFTTVKGKDSSDNDVNGQFNICNTVDSNTLCSHFPFSDGSTYIRPGQINKNITLDNADEIKFGAHKYTFSDNNNQQTSFNNEDMNNLKKLLYVDPSKVNTDNVQTSDITELKKNYANLLATVDSLKTTMGTSSSSANTSSINNGFANGVSKNVYINELNVSDTSKYSIFVISGNINSYGSFAAELDLLGYHYYSAGYHVKYRFNIIGVGQSFVQVYDDRNKPLITERTNSYNTDIEIIPTINALNGQIPKIYFNASSSNRSLTIKVALPRAPGTISGILGTMTGGRMTSWTTTVPIN